MRSFQESLPMALLQAREAAMRLFRPMLGRFDLTEQQWRVLRALSASDHAVEVGPLADATSLLPPSLSRILTNLEERGLITRSVAEHDQRRSMITLSRSGAALVTRIAPTSEATYNRIEAEFGTERLALLLAELHELASLDISEQDLYGHADAEPEEVS